MDVTTSPDGPRRNVGASTIDGRVVNDQMSSGQTYRFNASLGRSLVTSAIFKRSANVSFGLRTSTSRDFWKPSSSTLSVMNRASAARAISGVLNGPQSPSRALKYHSPFIAKIRSERKYVFSLWSSRLRMAGHCFVGEFVPRNFTRSAPATLAPACSPVYVACIAAAPSGELDRV